MAKREWNRAPCVWYLRPRCYHCESLAVLKRRGAMDDGSQYVVCKDCDGLTKCLEIPDHVMHRLDPLTESGEGSGR